MAKSMPEVWGSLKSVLELSLFVKSAFLEEISINICTHHGRHENIRGEMRREMESAAGEKVG
eukprot:866724-Amorphochlora_amoeboformis.AAC.2